jgi:hypothetical protein
MKAFGQIGPRESTRLFAYWCVSLWWVTIDCRSLKCFNKLSEQDGLILTKFDTVSDKVGVLTLTHQTARPLSLWTDKVPSFDSWSAPAIIQSLFQ